MIKMLMNGEPGFWQETWREDVLNYSIESAQGLAFVYVADKEIVGFICGHDLGFRAYLSELIVAKKYKGQGIGKRLVKQLESALVARGCKVLVADVWKDARGFYESLGWTSPNVILLRKQLKCTDSQLGLARDIIYMKTDT